MSSASYALLIRRTFLSAIQNRCSLYAKAAAYSALLSFFPVLTSAATILVQTRAQFVSRIVSEFLFEVVPPGTEEAVRYPLAIRGDRPVALIVVAVLLSIWAASGVIGSLIQGFQDAYGVTRQRSIPRHILLSMLLVLMSALPVLAASTLILFGGAIDRTVVRLLSGDPALTPVAGWWNSLYQLARYAIAFAAVVGVTSILYYYGPFRRQTWGHVLPGAVAATVGWLIVTATFGWYVRNIAQYNVLYGSIGASIALIVWMYLMAFVVLLGCQFNAERERLTTQ